MNLQDNDMPFGLSKAPDPYFYRMTKDKLNGTQYNLDTPVK